METQPSQAKFQNQLSTITESVVVIGIPHTHNLEVEQKTIGRYGHHTDSKKSCNNTHSREQYRNNDRPCLSIKNTHGYCYA